jgi:hypothetical protein
MELNFKVYNTREQTAKFLNRICLRELHLSQTSDSQETVDYKISLHSAWSDDSAIELSYTFRQKDKELNFRDLLRGGSNSKRMQSSEYHNLPEEDFILKLKVRKVREK